MKLATCLTAVALLGACTKSADAPPPPASPPPVASPPPAAPPPPAPAAEPFTGELRLAPGTDAKLLKPTDILFVMVRQCGIDCTQPGPMVAAQRHPDVKLPMKYTVGPESVMVPGTPFTGPFLVQARIDRDGDAMTKGADDLYAQVTTGVRPGQADVNLGLAPLPPGASPPTSATNPHGGLPGVGNPHGGGGGNPHGMPMKPAASPGK